MKLLRQIAHALRALRREPGFFVVAVLSLGLGIGANTAIFTLVNTVLLQSLPVRGIERLVNVYTRDSQNEAAGLIAVSVPNFEDLQATSQQFESLAAFTPSGATLLSEDSDAQQIPVVMVSGDYFTTLGVDAALGRTITAGDNAVPGESPVAVLSHGLWLRLFGNESALGATLRLNGSPFTVIGVAPADFRGINALSTPELAWTPLAMRGALLPPDFEMFFRERRALPLTVFGRLRPEATPGSVARELEAIGSRLAAEYPEANGTRTLEAAPMSEGTLGINQRDGLLQGTALLFGTVALVLAIACANVANLMLVRTTARVRELSIRASLGAGRAELMRLCLLDALLVALLGGAVGVALAHYGVDLLWNMRPPGLPANVADPAIDLRVLGFAVSVSVLTALAFGLAPALRASRPDLEAVLRASGRQPGAGAGSRLRNGLVIAEIALALVGLVGAGLFIRSLQLQRQAETGFDSDGLVVMSVGFANTFTPAQQEQYRLAALDRVWALPGIEAAAFATSFPLGGAQPRTILPADRDPEQAGGLFSGTMAITPGYFRTMGITLLQGRDVAMSDGADTHGVALVNETAAERYWPDESPLGKRFELYGVPLEREVVGVVADVATAGLGGPPQPVVYMPATQYPQPFAVLHVRTPGDPGLAMAAARDALQEVDRSLAVQNEQTFDDLMRTTLWARRTAAQLLSLFAALALLLAAVGVYGVLANVQRQRRLEIGIRMALGARPNDVLGLLLRHGVALAGAGLLIGGIASLAAARLATSMLFGIGTADPTTYVVTSLILLGVTLAACLGPALRARAVSPLLVMRQE